MFDSSEIMAVSAAIVCLEVCVRDIMNKAGMCGRSVSDVMINPFLLFVGRAEVCITL